MHRIYLRRQSQLAISNAYWLQVIRSVRVSFTSPTSRHVFADQLQKNGAVKVYAKLSRWFQIMKPLNGHNPDWAVPLIPMTRNGSALWLRSRAVSFPATSEYWRVPELSVVESL